MILNVKYPIILAVFLPGVFLQSHCQSYEGSIITQCEVESMTFQASERQYVDKRGLVFPSLQGPQNKDLLQQVYEKEKRQRPFECISSRMNEKSKLIFEMTPEYQRLTHRCKHEQPLVVCDPSNPYRTFDGTCNNMLNPKWGSAHTCGRRLMPASYEVGDELIDCCSNLNHQHPQCAPILLPPDDPVYSRLNITCFNFVRTAPCDSCSLGKRNQMIQTTSYIDGSVIYGLSEKDATDLRTNDGTGKLKTQHREEGEMLPPDYDLGFSCGSPENKEYCFKSGDRRVNMHAPLSSFHTIFVREHNRLAEELKELNPQWNEETLFQEARKIVGALLQVITYNEFLPLMLRSESMSAYNLRIGNEGRSVYNPQVDSTMLMEFSTGAFRLHTIVSGIVTDFGADGGKKTVTDFTRDASTIYHGEMERMLKGLCFTPIQEFDRHVAKELTQNLYRGREHYGFDLAAIDLQRARDTGIPSYTEVVRFLSGGASNIQTFDDLEQVFEHKDVELMKTAYCDPRDIDFDVGISYENTKDRSMCSKTADEIIAMQFSDLKFGDRFFFEHAGNFNDDQLRALKEVTLSRILCDNTKISSIQQYPMIFQSLSNPIKQCSEIPKLNLDYWKY